MHWWDTHTEWHWLMMVGMVLFWVVIIIAIVMGIQYLVRASRAQQPDNRESPENILKQRYARGEIDKQEYEERLRDLRK